MKKIVILLLAIILLTFSSCANQTSVIKNEKDSLTWWCENKYSHVNNTGDSEVYAVLMSKTGVDVVFIHPPKGEHRERFLALLNEQTLPDIITHDFVNDYAGGVEKALNDGIIIPLNDTIEQYCPNLNQYLIGNPEVKELISTKDGRIFCFPSIQQEREIRTYIGPFIRKDYLDKLGLSLPTTVDDWYELLTAFKSELEITPLSFYGGKIIDTNFLIGAYGISWDFYQENGLVKFGPMEDEFAQFMLEFKKWYQEGLISSGVFTDSQKTYVAKAKRGQVGIYIDYISSMATYQSNITGAEFKPLTYPVLEEKDTAFSGHIAPVFVPYSSCYISSSNKDIEATAKLLDYAYSDEGGLLFNFGILGESYEMIDGEPYYTDGIISCEDGFSNAVKRYLASGAYIRDERQFKQMLILDCQKEAVTIWSDTQAEKHQIPPIVLTQEQAEIVSSFNSVYKDTLLNWLKDYCLSDNATTVKALREKLQDLGIEEVIRVYQEVVDET